MHRVDAPGATIDNLFTEGNPSIPIAPTEVSDDWLNDVQEEIVTVIEDAGITLVKGQQDQLKAAILVMLGLGGSGLQQTVLNNSGPNNVTGLIFAKATFKAARVLYDIHRETDSSNVQEIGELFVTHDSKDDAWRISTTAYLDEAGVAFTITSTGQIQYTSDNLAGANYVGELRVVDIVKLKQTI